MIFPIILSSQLKKNFLCLVEDVQSQFTASNQKIKDLQNELTEVKEIMSRQDVKIEEFLKKR